MAKQRPYRARRVDTKGEIAQEVKQDNSVGDKPFVYGDKATVGGRVFIIPADAEVDSHAHEDDEYIIGIIEVHPDSVSQSTGRQDKHGVEIYGGDTCKFISPIQRQDLSPAVVEWSDEGCYWKLQGKLPLLLHRAIDIEIITEGDKK